eukprot:m.234535 g.234535  ORF g.234535 m.234535 type:complete len:160 (+) comp19324_c0_seq1:335-814(+)
MKKTLAQVYSWCKCCYTLCVTAISTPGSLMSPFVWEDAPTVSITVPGMCNAVGAAQETSDVTSVAVVPHRSCMYTRTLALLVQGTLSHTISTAANWPNSPANASGVGAVGTTGSVICVVPSPAWSVTLARGLFHAEWPCHAMVRVYSLATPSSRAGSVD